jgi:hypothetical protein
MNPTAVLSSPWLLCRRQFVGRHRLLQCYRRITAGSRKEVASIYLKLHEPSMAGRMGQGAAQNCGWQHQKCAVDVPRTDRNECPMTADAKHDITEEWAWQTNSSTRTRAIESALPKRATPISSSFLQKTRFPPAMLRHGLLGGDHTCPSRRGLKTVIRRPAEA